MKHRFQVITALLIIILFSVVPVSHPIANPHQTYVEPQLQSAQADALAVIVTGDSSQTAARAVERLGGQVTSDLWLIDAVAATLPAEQLAALAADPAVVSIVDNKGVKDAQEPPPGWITKLWNFLSSFFDQNEPDAQPTQDPTVWDLANPVSIDVGADVLHQDHNITGQGVTVAVLDSGVHFSDEVMNAIGTEVSNAFKGQADFVNNGACQNGKGVQHNKHCFTNETESNDGYGHGSHVAGIIWNKYTDSDTGVYAGVAPNANILSVRVLGEDGTGTYEDVIEGIQYVIDNKDLYNIRILNLSLSAYATTPYFVDPLNRAAEAAWANGIVVVTAAGNTGSGSESITVPGNDPYVITVGAINNNRTPGYWADDIMPSWSATGPTWDGFAKPDLLAPGTYITSFMNNAADDSQDDILVTQHPDNAISNSLFRMSGTSQATAVVSGVVALMLEDEPNLTPDQIKYRLMVSARPALTDDVEPDLVYNILQQGMGRVWAPEAVLGDFPADNHANYGMDINADLAHGMGWVDHNGDGMVDPDEVDPNEMAYHYTGQIGRMTSDDGRAYLYYLTNTVGIGSSQGGDTDEGTGGSIETVRDEFNGVSFSGNDGSQNWAGDWIEDDVAGGGPTAGNVQINNNEVRLGDQPDTGTQPSIAREVNLSGGATSATFSFDFNTSAGVDSDQDQIAVEVSGNGGASYTTLEILNDISGVASGSKSYDISVYMSTNTRVRIRVHDYYGGDNEYFAVDNVQIEYGTGSATGGSIETVRDEFNENVYSNNDGSVNWSSSWQEWGESDGVSSGRVRVYYSSRCAAGNCLRIGGDESSIEGRGAGREVNLSNATTATLTYSYRRYRDEDSGRQR